ncbi:MAG: hydrogenase small subunit [Propionibacteriaceae bacterium]|nr:hydrogenase small subunit [Propionibacteriaceae bacterium]
MTYTMDGWQEPTLAENLERAGVSRRDFLKFCGGLAAAFAAGSAVMGSVPRALADPTPGAPVTGTQVADALGSMTKPNVVWLQLQECTGCMESALRSGGTTVEDVVLNLLSVNYNELVMAAAGDAANSVLDKTNEDDHILVVNGSIPTKDNGIYCTIGGKSAETVLRESAEHAVAVLAVGACAVFGSVQASRPNPTGAVGVDQIITNKPVINVSGCPPIGEVIMATIAYYLTHGDVPKTDAEGRPMFAYDQRIHDSCPRRAHFDAGQYVRSFDDEAARTGWCLYDMGCKGPSTFSPCPFVQWNGRTSWPIGAGHPCLGCTEKDFFDRFTPFYNRLPQVPGFGVETTAEKVGLGLVGLTVAAVGVHAGVTAIRKSAAKKTHDETPLEAFGDAPAGEQAAVAAVVEVPEEIPAASPQASDTPPTTDSEKTE